MAEKDPKLNFPAYEADYAAWLAAQVELLRAGDFEQLDLDNLLDEVESLGRSDFNGFVGSFEILIAHMLKWDYQPSYRTNGWIASIDEHRARIERDLFDSPSYRSRLDAAIERAYRPGRALAAKETRLDLRSFPQSCPYDFPMLISRVHELASRADHKPE